MSESDLLNLPQLAERMGVCVRSVNNWMKAGLLPRPIRLTRATSYFLWSDVVNHLSALKNRPAAANQSAVESQTAVTLVEG
jgi:predicted DNA-binding transcriptional regulator AlpA